MMVSKEQFITATEFANRYNKSRPIDKDFTPLEPSFVKLLCEQGKLEHSTLPARDGRKKDVYMIPEHELETVDVILNGNKTVKDEPGRLMDANEVAEFLDRSPNNVIVLAKRGDLKARKVDNPHGGMKKYVFDENDVLKFAEEHPKRAYTKRAKPEKDIPEPVMSEPDNSDEIEELNAMVESLRATIKKLVFENTDLKDRLDHASKTSNDKDIFDAYRRGFKDGFEMGGAH